MKKTISLLCVSLFSFAVFAPAFAQSTDSNVSVEPMRQALIQVLTQLLHQLEAQLQTLLAQRGNNQNNSFTVSLSSGLAPLSVQFTNTIQSAGSESIDYGDGTTATYNGADLTSSTQTIEGITTTYYNW